MRRAPTFVRGLRLPGLSPQRDPAPPGSPRFPGPLLLATDGAASADGAVTLAAHLVHYRDARLQLLTVLEPDSAEVLAGALAGGAPSRVRHFVDDHRAGRHLAVRAQLERVADLIELPDIDAVVGPPASTITREAAERGASLIIVGLRSHSILDRLFRDDTTLRIMRRATVPVLAVTPVVHELPRRAVVGVDFSMSSLHAARAALAVLADDVTLYLAHVEHAGGAAGGPADGAAEHENLLAGTQAAAFDRFRQLLGAGAGIRVEQVVLEGDNFAALDDFSGRVGATLVALGSIRRDEPTPRGGRLREAFVRAAAVSVLLGPPAPRASIFEA